MLCTGCQVNRYGALHVQFFCARCWGAGFEVYLWSVKTPTRGNVEQHGAIRPHPSFFWQVPKGDLAPFHRRGALHAQFFCVRCWGAGFGVYLWLVKTRTRGNLTSPHLFLASSETQFGPSPQERGATRAVFLRQMLGCGVWCLLVVGENTDQRQSDLTPSSFGKFRNAIWPLSTGEGHYTRSFSAPDVGVRCLVFTCGW
jgi:hypothetical protein